MSVIGFLFEYDVFSILEYVYRYFQLTFYTTFLVIKRELYIIGKPE